jgi:hypothetical protein
MQPSLPEIKEVSASVRAQIAFAGGADLYPEYARAGRCSLAGQGVVAQLQYSANPPGNPAFQVMYRDPDSGEEFRSPEPRGPMTRLAWDGDTESGRATFSLEMALPATVRDPQNEPGPNDCLLTIFTFSGAPAAGAGAG